MENAAGDDGLKSPARPPSRERLIAADSELSHNLLGQRLGRKGRVTRERILAATERLLAGPRDVPVSLSAVAREASLGMTTLYLYFADLTELLLAVMEPVLQAAEAAYVAHLREPWPDEDLGQHCREFVQSYHGFWSQHGRVLHLRNNSSDAGDKRMMDHRIRNAEPIIKLLVVQMNRDPEIILSPAYGIATVCITAIERFAMVATGEAFAQLQPDMTPFVDSMLLAEARLLELGIRDCRATAEPF